MTGGVRKTPRDRLALILGQWFGCGLAPKGPGTVGSAGALPLVYLAHGSPWLYGAITLSIGVLGVVVSQRCSELLGEKDPSSVVIDEVAGVLIAIGPVLQAPWPYWVAAWVLFRVLDITKPGWIDRVQYLSPPGLGIMADDVLAGLLAGAVTAGVYFGLG